MLKTYHESCHCGRVGLEVQMDFQGGSKCNCRYCWKQRHWNVQVDPANFRLVRGVEHLGDYARVGSGFETHHRFCRECGTATHGHGSIDAMGGAYAGVRIAALEELSVEEHRMATKGAKRQTLIPVDPSRQPPSAPPHFALAY